MDCLDLNLNDCCRLCSSSDNVNYKFSTILNDFSAFIEILKLLKISIESNDLYKVCEECFMFVKKIRIFIKRCMEVNNLFTKQTKVVILSIKKIDKKTEEYVEDDDFKEIDISEDDNFNEITDFEDETNDFECEELTEISFENDKSEDESSDEFQCNYCNEIFITNDELSLHKKEKHLKPYQCSLCDNTYQTKNGLKTHLRFHKGNMCEECDVKFDTKADLIEHQSVDHNDESKKNYLCTKCDKIFEKFFEYYLHKKDRHPQFRYECSKCKKEFSNRLYMLRHEKTHLENKKIYNEICTICGKVFLRKSYLKLHMRVKHSDERPYICDVCGSTFKLRSNLMEHKVTHSTDRPFQCKICFKSFKSRARLNFHGVHHSDRSFPCTKCSVVCKTITYLRSHMETHETNQPYECEVCSKRFKQQKILKRHIKREHFIREKAVCEFCSKEFKDDYNCRRHKRAMHKELIGPEFNLRT